MSEVAYLEDAARERRIAKLSSDLGRTNDRERQYDIWHQLKSELMARSPALIRLMEAEMGLD